MTCLFSHLFGYCFFNLLSSYLATQPQCVINSVFSVWPCFLDIKRLLAAIARGSLGNQPSFLHFWHAPLRVCSAKRRHQSPKWAILSQVDCFVQGEVKWLNRTTLTCIKTTLCDALHWLDVAERIEYKLGVSVYRCLHGQASVPRRPPHPSLWRCSAPSLSTICQPKPSLGTSLST